MKLEYIVKSTDNYKNINQILKNEFKVSSRLFTKLIKNNNVLLNAKYVDTRTNIKENDVITVKLDYNENNSNIIPIGMKLDIIYEDKHILAINKPANIPVHPSMLHYENSLSNGVKFYFDQISLKKKIRPVNRLDKDTSGIVIFAKNEYIQECLITQMQNNIFKKEYLAIVDGILEIKKRNYR